MSIVYVKSVGSSSRSQWISGNSYVAGDRVYLQSSTLKSYTLSGTEFDSWRTYVCLIDNSSTTSPEEDSVNWVEAGSSREYPYHSVGGNLTLSGETYLEEINNRYASSGINGSLYHHLRRDESTYSLGRMIIVSDNPNPIFKCTLNAAIIGFSIEPELSINNETTVSLNLLSLSCLKLNGSPGRVITLCS